MPQIFHRGTGRRRKGLLFAVALFFILSGPILSTPLIPVSADPPAECVFTGVETTVAIGDLHGGFDPFVQILQELKIINRNLHWTGGKTHLVQLGDVMDRGPGAREIFDLIRRLEGEARTAGGAVHMLLGNHEELNMLGLSFENKGDVTPEQFRAFLPAWIRDRKEIEFRHKASTYEEYDRLWEQYMEGNPQARNIYTNSFNQTYGKWLSRHPVVIKINDIVFVHGGLTETLSVLPCDTINEGIANEFSRYFAKEEFDWVWLFQPRGPLWYRDLAVKDEKTLSEEVDRILGNLGARAIVIGHTTITGRIPEREITRLGGKIWIIDTGIGLKKGGRKSALIIENGNIRMESFLFSEER